MTEREKAAADAALAALPTGVLRRTVWPVKVTDFQFDEAAGAWSIAFEVMDVPLVIADRDVEEIAVYADGSYLQRLT
ncbi:hypothetical protein [Methylobacterium sp. Leaf106]|uniref:hypothetical protein n=1 Tax=Methylobacterium sp. Leaf106 TaxID=1736255 RepID=UPI0006F7E0E3|nr:hypothetical protein [Methylobacterium sp. Leaf106]KQP50367.1 hypothetical protein ASF34_20030 [Methylobacterium sp. Leaf106]